MPAFSPAPSSQGKGNSNNSSNATSLISKEYLEAASVLNEDTMNRACHLLLKASDNDDADTANTELSTTSIHPSKKKGTDAAAHGNVDKETPVKDQLLEMYYKCKESLTVIRKQQLSLPPSTGPLGIASSGSITKKGSSHKMLPLGAPSLNGMKKRTVMTSKHGIHPSHKTTSSAIGLGVGALKQKGMMPMAMKRMASLNKIGSTNKLGSIVSVNMTSTTKTITSATAIGKAMLSARGRSISPPQSSLRSEDSVSSAAPPPSALSFLAKLNRDPNDTSAAVPSFGDDKSDGPTKEESEEVGEEKESTEYSKKNKRKKKSKSKRKTSDDNDRNMEEKDKNEETDDSEKKKDVKKEVVEDQETHRRKRRRPTKSDMEVGNDNDKSNDSPSKRRKVARRGERVSKKRPVIDDDDEDVNSKDHPDDEEEEPSPPSSNDDDGDTSADETYHVRPENNPPTKRKSFSRKAKPDAATLTGDRTPPSKKQKTRNHDKQQHAEEATESSEDTSPSRRRNPRRGTSQA